jgi:hypothetical protein
MKNIIGKNGNKEFSIPKTSLIITKLQEGQMSPI